MKYIYKKNMVSKCDILRNLCYLNFFKKAVTKPKGYAFYVVLSILGSFGQSGCKKFVEVPPPTTQIISSTIFENDATATAAVIAIYSNIMSSQFGFSSGGTTLYAGLSADELKNYSTSLAQSEFFTNSLTAGNSIVGNLWNEIYSRIYAANAIIEGLANSSGVIESVKKQLLGEAKFIRAFCHFYAANLWGDIPFVTATDYRVNAVIARTPLDQVYQMIISDLKDAQILLNESYVKSDNSIYTGSPERIRPNKSVATAFLARVYLFSGDYVNAEAQATAVISSTAMYDTVSLNKVFLKNSKEAIWQLQPVLPGRNTNEGVNFILTTTPTLAALSSQLLNAFEMGDSRRSSWIGSDTVGTNIYYYPYKYKVKNVSTVTEYYMVLRLAEQYLIRAEARAKQNNLNGALTDLNIIRTRAGLVNLPILLTQVQILTAIEQERRIELFSEWGHRWLDLKRTNRADAVMSSLKTTNWQLTDVLYPIPQAQVLNDPNMTQNAGY